MSHNSVYVNISKRVWAKDPAHPDRLAAAPYGPAFHSMSGLFD
jgi:hypothetical protein